MSNQQWQLEDGTPNWALYPDATHYCPDTFDTVEAFLKRDEQGVLWFVSQYYPVWTEDEFAGDDTNLNDPELFVAKQ